MPQFDQSAAETKLRELIRLNVPDTPLSRVSVKPATNFAGEPSLSVRVIFQEIPDDGLTEPMTKVRDRFRSWLATEKDDERFPYFRVLSEADERELQAPDAD